MTGIARGVGGAAARQTQTHTRCPERVTVQGNGYGQGFQAHCGRCSSCGRGHEMLTRRLVLAAAASLPALPVRAEAGFSDFLAGLRAEARRDGISDRTLDQALGGLTPN